VILRRFNRYTASKGGNKRPRAAFWMAACGTCPLAIAHPAINIRLQTPLGIDVRLHTDKKTIKGSHFELTLREYSVFYMFRLALCCSIVFLSTHYFSVNLMAQNPSASLTGTIHDPGGRAIPDARVELTQEETGLSRVTGTSSSGTYAVQSLPIGTWAISVEKSGFAATRVPSIELLVGQTRQIDLTLPLAGQTTQLNVTANVSEVDQNSAVVGARMIQKQIEGLPINGRNWATLMPFVPGATDSGTSDQRTVRFVGHGRDDNNTTYDGVDATGISNQPQKTGIRLAISTSTISEFKVDSTLYTVDSADGTGGQILIASAGGSNVLHAEAFEFFRNDVFDARNPFAAQNPPFRLNEFGANSGGPVFGKNTFFFVAFEGSRQRLDQTLQGFTPSASFRAAALASSPQLAPVLNAFRWGICLRRPIRI
jgi:hypothetical protein